MSMNRPPNSSDLLTHLSPPHKADLRVAFPLRDSLRLDAQTGREILLAQASVSDHFMRVPSVRFTSQTIDGLTQIKRLI
jgi:hypothetical protein